VLREEREVEAEEKEPEMDLCQAFVIHPPGNLREPVVDAGEDAKHGSPEEHVVHVRDDEVRIVRLIVEGEDGEHDPGQASHGEEADEAEREHEGRAKDQVSAPEGREPVEDLHRGRHRDRE